MNFADKYSKWLISLYVLLSLGYLNGALAEKTPAIQQVIVGMYPININTFDTHAGNYKMNFYVWYKTPSKDFKSDAVEVLNSADATITGSTRAYTKNEGYNTTVHYQATLDHHWNFRYYPFDKQHFKVVLEAVDPIDTIKLVPDYQQSTPNTNIILDNWKTIGSHITPSITNYNTNFGVNSAFGSRYSRVTFFYNYQHEGWRIFFNLFSAFFVCALFCILTHLFNDTDIRIQLILTAVIGFIGNKYIVDGIIPDVSYFTLSDGIQAATFLTMLIALAGLIVERSIKEHLKKSVNTLFVLFTSLGYVGYVGYQVYQAATQ